LQITPYSFPKSARLLTKTQYRAVFDGSCKISNEVFTVFKLKNQQNVARLGLAISRKCAKRAVDRNRIKRLIRESFRMIKIDLPALDFVVICRPGVSELTNFTLKTSFLNQIKKICQRTCAD